MQNLYQLVRPKFSLINSHRYMSWATSPCMWEHDRPLMKILQTGKGWIDEKNNCWVSSETVEMAYVVCSLTNNWSTGFAKWLSGSDRRRSEWTGWNVKSTKLQPRRTTTSFILRVEMFSVNFVTFAFCKLFWNVKMPENVAVLCFLSSSLTCCQTKKI